MIAGVLYAKHDKQMLQRCKWRKNLITYIGGVKTDACITSDGYYNLVEPQLPEELDEVLAIVLLKGALPPDESEYARAVKDAVVALYGGGALGVFTSRRARDVLSMYRQNLNVVHYYFDRWTGRGEFSGYGAVEAVMRDQMLTEVVIPQPLVEPRKWTEMPKNPRDILAQVKVEVIDLRRYRRVVAVRNEVRMATNVVIPEIYMPILVKRLVPSLTLANPFQTKEDAQYRARIAADFIEYNVNTRKMSETPRPSKSIIKTWVAKPAMVDESVAAAERVPLEGLRLFALGTIAMEARWTVIFSGAMGTGKTTQLNLLLYFTPPWAQVVVVERGAREIWAPLEGQILHISAFKEEMLEAAMDQALRYGTVDTIVALAEARTSKELRRLVEYKLTGHGGITTMHSETIDDALLRIYQSGAPPEALAGTLVFQLSAMAGVRYLKEWRALIAKGAKVEAAAEEEVLALLNSYTRAIYGTGIDEELEIRARLVKMVAEKERAPADAREEILKLFARRKLTEVDEVAKKFGYQPWEEALAFVP